MTVSIIVPMFHGKKYLESILNQAALCAEAVAETDVELILYNDSPEEEICVKEAEYPFRVKCFHSEYNSGIHGARVHGLEQAAGEYVVFLDQDDRIAPSYLKKQLECIGASDAVVCRAIHNNRLFYTNTHVFEKVITKDFMLRNRNPIISPGQVLLRKDAIPTLWKKCILQNNGADDYFLWLLMASEERTFSLNQEVLFEHVETGMNTSGNTNNMMDSEAEMIGFLRERHVFGNECEKVLMELSESLRRMHVRLLDNYKKIYDFLRCWNERLAKGISPLAFFEENHIKRIALYGAGDFGRNIEMLLKNTDIRVCFYIDQNAEYVFSELPVYKKEEIREEADAIIITIDDKSVRSELEKIVSCPVFEPNDIWLFLDRCCEGSAAESTCFGQA